MTDRIETLPTVSGNTRGAGQHWHQQLSNTKPSPYLFEPLRIRPANDSRSVERIDMSDELQRKILELCDKRDWSVYAVLVSAIQILIHQYTCDEQVTILSPMLPEEDKAGNAQVRFVPILYTLLANTSFKSHLMSVSQAILDSYANQAYLADVLQNDTYSFSIEELSTIVCELSSLHTSNPAYANEHVIFRFTYELDALHGEILFNKTLYPDVYIKQCARQLVSILDQSVSSISGKLHEIQLNQDAACHHGKEAILPDSSFVELFEESANRFSESIACVYQEQNKTYRQLNEEANRLARYLLKRQSLKSDDLVVVLMDRSIHMVQSILAIWKCKAAYLPISPHYPVERIVDLLSRSKSVMVISEDKYSNAPWVAQVADATIVWIEEALLASSSEHRENLANQPSPADLAYVIYTSGSTGEPKGVMIEHVGMINHMYAKIEDLEMDAACVVAQNASQCFDISVWQFFAPLLVGGRCVIFSNEQVRDLEAFLKIVQEKHVTILELVPSYLQLVLDQMELELIPLGLSYLVVTGEALKKEVVNQWFGYFNNIKLINAYGATESSDDTTHQLFEGPIDRDTVPIGKPVQNFSIYILNSKRRKCPLGVKGEIYYAGIGVGRGYLFDEERTKAAFMRDPFQAGEVRMYKTGDLGRYLPDGSLEFFGRRDHQIKVNGHRVELQEIEYFLMQLDEIKDVVVVAVGEEEITLCAYYIKHAHAELTRQQIKDRFRQKLPDYMIPHYLVAVESFPLNSNGKVDRKALPRPSFRAESKKLATTGTEIKLSDLWQRLLEHEQVALDDNFFELGGHSLKAIKLVSHIYREFGVKLTVDTVFEHPTIQQLAQVVDRAEKQQYEAIEPVAEQAIYETSTAQKRLWIIDQLEEEKFAYNIPHAFVLKGKLDQTKFEDAIYHLIDRHEILRTTFISVDGIPFQKVHNTSAFDFRVERVEVAHEQIDQYVQAEEKYLFNLEEGPLIRVILLKIHPDYHVVLLTMHHIIADAWSLEVIKDELFTLYNTLLKDEEPQLPPQAIQYKDYATWEKKQIKSRRYEDDKSYWLKQFEGEIPVLTLPTQSRPSEKTYKGKVKGQWLTTAVRDRLFRLGQDREVSLFMMLLSCVGVILHKYSNQRDLVIGSPIAGRSTAELEHQIGFYVNLLPLRINIDPRISFQDLLDQVKRLSLDAYEHQLYPFDQLVEDLNLERDLSRAPLVDVLVVLMNTEVSSKFNTLQGIMIEDQPLERTVVKYDLQFNFHEENDKIFFSLEYNTDLFEDEFINNFIENFERLVERVSTDPSQPIGTVDYLSPIELLRLTEFNTTTVNLQNAPTIFHLIDQRTAKHPDVLALAFEDSEYSFKDLTVSVNQLANFLLRRKKVAPKEKVAVLLGRSENSVIAMLAVLKIGAVYAPIDQNQPEDRIQVILDDLQPRLVLLSKELLGKYTLLSSEELVYEEIDLRRISSHSPEVVLHLSMPAYIIYTSGSTGVPKGIIQTHQTLHNLIHWQLKHWQLGAGQKYLHYNSFGFDVSVQDVLFSLTCGLSVHLLNDRQRSDFQAIRNIIVEKSVNVICLTYSALVALFDEIEIDSFHLNHIITTGEQAYFDNSLGDYLKEHPQTYIHNFYGPSETHVATTFTRRALDSGIPVKSPIGKPIFNTVIYVLSDQLMLQPIGVVGEIYIGGAGVFQEYLNNHDLTVAKKIRNPYDATQFLYKTGDLGRWLPSGELEFMGRYDKQVKIRGFRIELEEIEFQVNQHPNIKNSVVIAQEQNSDPHLVCYFVLENKHETVPIADLIAWLEKTLPHYMIPISFSVLDQLPININGKIDLKALHKVERKLSSGPVLPENEIQERMVLIWKDILGLDSVGISDNFFKIGGHSLAATRFVSRIHQEFDVKLSLKLIYTLLTIQKLAEEVDTLVWLKKTSEEPTPMGERFVI